MRYLILHIQLAHSLYSCNALNVLYTYVLMGCFILYISRIRVQGQLFQRFHRLAGMDYRISPSISREIYPRTKYYTDNSSYTRVTPSGKKLYQKQVEF